MAYPGAKLKDQQLWEMHCKDLSRAPRMKKWQREEIYKTLRMAKRGEVGEEVEKEARRMLLEGNLRLAFAYAKQFSFDYRMEALQCAYEGLIKAAEKFDPYKNVTFATYAMYWMRGIWIRQYDFQEHLVHIPVYVQDHYHKIINAREWLRNRKGQDISYDKVAEWLGMEPERVALYVNAVNYKRFIYYYHEYSEEDDLFNRMMEDPNVVDADEKIRSAMFWPWLMDLIYDRVEKGRLDERSPAIIEWYFLFGDGQTLQWIGDQLGLTRERVRQILEATLEKIRPAIVAYLRGSDIHGISDWPHEEDLDEDSLE